MIEIGICKLQSELDRTAWHDLQPWRSRIAQEKENDLDGVAPAPATSTRRSSRSRRRTPEAPGQTRTCAVSLTASARGQVQIADSLNWL